MKTVSVNWDMVNARENSQEFPRICKACSSHQVQLKGWTTDAPGGFVLYKCRTCQAQWGEFNEKELHSSRGG